MLEHAVSSGRLLVARVLHTAGADVNSSDSDRTLMHDAATSGSLAVVKWLQSLGLDARVVLTRESQLLPLHCACQSGHLQLAEYLLALPGAGDDVHARSTKGHTLLQLAAMYGADSVVQLLLQRGATADARGINDCTALMAASSPSIVKQLLAAGADVAAVANTGQSVLQCQALRGACAGSVCLLLKAGADPTVALHLDGESVTAAALAGINGHFALEALLSRAADDYRKKHPTVNSTVSDSSSGSSSDASSSVIDSAAAHNSSGRGNNDDTSGSTTAAGISTTAAAAEIADTTDGKDSATTSAAAAAGDDDARNTELTQQQQQQCKQRKVKQPCAYCSKPTTNLCRRCAAVYYCSVDCQKVCFLEAQHKAQCEATAAEVL
jgi:ankyrin repeat protein